MNLQEQKQKASYLDEFKIVKELGRGYHSKVKLSLKEGKEYAIKIYDQNTADLSVLKHQIEILSKLKHENVIEFYEARENAIYLNSNGYQSKCFALILEYNDGSELFDYIAYSGRFSPNIARTYFIMLLNALEYIHKQEIAHRDIKPENILLDKNFNLKVIDFGFSTFLTNENLSSNLGTRGYKAPQIYKNNYDGKKADVFAAGVLLFIMYTGSPPFADTLSMDPHYSLFCKQNAKFWKSFQNHKPKGFYCQNFKNLINGMLDLNPNNRLSFDEIRNHAWTTGDCLTFNELEIQFKDRKQKVDKAKQLKMQQQEKKEMNKKKLETNSN